MFIVKYLSRFRLLLYISFIICIVIVTTNQYWGNLLPEKTLRTPSYEDNITTDDYNTKELLSDEVRISEIYPNCGLQYTCPDNTFPVHVYTGEDKDDQPRLCVFGKYYGGGGRGLNIAVVDAKYLQIVTLQNFDLYSQNSTSLELWLASYLRVNDIVIVFTFDEASKELSKKAKHMLYELGSGKIQDLQYRSQWYMITQKGISGFTPLERISYARNNKWGEVIDERLCVPKKIEPLMISPDPFPTINPLREQLCTLSNELRCVDFCGPLERHEPILPSLMTNRSLIGNTVFSTPFIVIAGKSITTLVLTLQSVVYQPGIHSASVFVLQEEGEEEIYKLTKVFNFQPLIINSTSTVPNYKIHFGLNFIHENFPTKKFVIVIEEGLLLSPDYLFYLAQLVPVLERDETLLGISGWNPYGYNSTSGNPYLAYRVEDFPGLGFLIKMDVFVKSMKGNMEKCCNGKSYNGWAYILQENEGHIIIPDVSRVLMRPRDIPKEREDDYRIFRTPRITNTNLNVWIERPQDLLQDRYFQVIANLIHGSITIHLTNDDLQLCANKGNIAMKIMLTELKNKIFTVYYQEENCVYQEKLKGYLKCFDVFLPNYSKVQTLYKNIMRFTAKSNMVLLIELNSPFAKHKKKKLI
ncbi:protein O-linked-mannose beta-1,2-N-acetylglucosaminyltransferase 1-like [Cimex lectularius]|uniref:Alpha-1,3-mannosyl-glycoprotein 2-beta-N-acetylglucosaminyltransferase n=1 Tax=Cimex lectularius TaxID=79782 RepID=A0A8I6RN43_CIMLE|nr:protein O-linked-mannose beta-1,2-N-acetylglucosaminyltransferase 1-like [Cimex lectularius]